MSYPAPLYELRDKVAFITGGSSGIGLGLARACAKAGMRVAITYLSRSHVKDARRWFADRAHTFHAIRADVRDRSEMKAAAKEAYETFGGVNLVCANAGVGTIASVCDANVEDWDDAIATNIMGVINTIAPFLPMIAREGAAPAHIVATSSMSGLFHGGSAGVYTTTKFAVVGMMEALRSELQPKGVGVSVFCPGLVQSNIFNRLRNRRAGAVDTPEPDGRVREVMAVGMDPLECGKRVLSGVRRNAMYILTHPEYRHGFEDRCGAVMGAFDAYEEAAPPARLAAERVVLRHRVYAEEVERQSALEENRNEA